MKLVCRFTCQNIQFLWHACEINRPAGFHVYVCVLTNVLSAVVDARTLCPASINVRVVQMYYCYY